MTTVKSDLEAALKLAEGKWAIIKGLDDIEQFSERAKIVEAGGGQFIQFKGLDFRILGLFAPDGALVFTQRLNHAEGSDTPVYGTRPDHIPARGVFARLAVRLVEGQKIPEIPDTLPDGWDQ